MEKTELTRRAEDLAERCERKACVTSTGFLTPAEQYEIRQLPSLFFGGYEEAERKVAFFLPDWAEPESLDFSEYLCAVKAAAFFGTPGHRDYLGAILGAGIKREWLGDILISPEGDSAWILCLPSVKSTLLELEKVGRTTVRMEEIPLSELPKPEKKVKKLSFTVMSTRLDAIVGDLFGLSRGKASEAIRAGLVSLNYTLCEKTDAPVRAGDVISLRGKGKGTVTELSGETKKGRIIVNAELYL